MTVSENSITDMWKRHFSTLFNSISDNTNKSCVEHFLLNTDYEYVIFRRCDIATGVKTLL